MFLFWIQMFIEDNIDDAKYCGHLYGVGTSFVMNGNSTNPYYNGHAWDTTSSTWIPC